MNFLLKKYKLFFFFCTLICLNNLISCYKKEKTIAIITVLDTNTNDPIVNAEVRLFFDTSNASIPPLIDVTEYTSSNGSAIFDFSDMYQDGQAGFAVLDIEIDGTFMGVINIVEMTSTEKEVFIP